MRRRWAIAGSIAALAIQASLARAPESLLPIEVSLPVAPIPVRAAGASHLFYELHLTNFRNAPLELTRVDVYAGGAEGSLVASYSGQDISDRLLRPGTPRDLQDKRTLGGGLRAVLMLHLVGSRIRRLAGRRNCMNCKGRTCWR